MRKMTKFEYAVMMADLAFTKLKVAIGMLLGRVTAETTNFEGGIRTVYKNKKGEVIFEYGEF